MVKALEGLSGIEIVVASFAEKNAVVRYDPASVNLDQIFQVLLKAGYVASVAESDKQASDIFNPLASEKIVFQKDDLVCFCFGYTRNDIEQDYINDGRSLIMERIAAEKKAGGCDCAVKNPKGL